MHSNIGGSYDDQGMADVTLAWMMKQLEGLLEFDVEYLKWMVGLNKKYYTDHNQPVRKYGMGKIYNSMVGVQRLAGEVVRTPGHYCTAPTDDQKTPRRPLVNTHESIHASVRMRMEQEGKGTDDKGLYKPTALRGWVASKKSGRWVWESPANGQEKVVLPEDELEGIEIDLLQFSK